MKAFTKKLLAVAFCLTVALSLMLINPLSVSAEANGDVEDPIKDKYSESVIIFTDEVSARAEEITAEDEYILNISVSGAGVSSFSFRSYFPDFIQVVDVEPSYELQSVENAAFDWDLNENMIEVSVAYSSAVEHSCCQIICVTFRFVSNEQNEGYPDFGDSIFTNLKGEYLPVQINAGRIAIVGEGAVRGDADGNGFVELADVMTILRYIVSRDHELGDEQYQAADVDRNGTVDIVDCQHIQNYLAGIIDSFDELDQGGAEDKCMHNNRQELFVNEPACNREGYIEYYCPDCDQNFSESQGFGGHSFGEDGVCINCGEREYIEEDEVFYTVNHDGATFVFYTSGKCEMVEKVYSSDGTVTEKKMEYTWEKRGKDLIVKADGISYSFEYVGAECYHDNREMLERFEGNCVTQGYIRFYCNDCGDEFSDPLGFGGHEVNDSGFCMHCYEQIYSEIIEIGIQELQDIAFSLVVEMRHDEILFIRGTVDEILDEESGVYNIRDDKGQTVSVCMANGFRLSLGETVTLMGVPAKYIYGNEAYWVMADAELVSAAMGESVELTDFAEFNDIAYNLVGGYDTTENEYRVSGTVTHVVDAEEHIFRIADNEGRHIYVYYLGLGGWDMPRIGDTITVTGLILKGTTEPDSFVVGVVEAYLESVETHNQSISIGEAVEIGESLNILAENLDSEYTVSGTISRIENPTYGKMYLTDGEGNEMLIYGFLDPSQAKMLKEGQVITVTGIGAKYYNAAEQTVVIEMKNAVLVESADGVKVDSIYDFNAAVNALNGTATAEGLYELTGFVDGDPNQTYGNLYLTDGEGNTIYIYGLYDEQGVRYDGMEFRPVNGDKITVRGYISHFIDRENNVVVEIKNAVLMNNEKSESGNVTVNGK